ncbi:MAG TPA: diacylglycerol kinase family protein [Streptosporangiaceae bacterium]|nr:diacylglycerol kinase family protein [Streptosporangiaceae bacterium]
MADVAFIINRTCVRDGDGLRRRCRGAAVNAGCEPVFLATSVDEAGSGLASDAVADGAGLVFAAGGDGTVRACAQALAGTRVPLALLPLGTANLAARALGVPSRVGAALAAGFGGRDRLVDVGDADGMTFLAMAGMGLDAGVVGATPPRLKGLLGWAAYAATGAVHVLASSPQLRRGHQFRVRLDDRDPLARRAQSVVAANTGLLPGGFVLLPGASPEDGLLDVGVLAPASIPDWVRVAHNVLTQDPAGGPHLERHRARRVEISADALLPRQVDGEVISPGRSLTVTVRPRALRVRVPAAASPNHD